ncbi:MAG: hypothetical protein OJF61_001954 [Rhodanobacteraceae bacterium]|jgi:hypothetical protein|nr:MAG: hypothetical protein OJF61_001954 [Rhodanobacteraceae bacterium]
MALQSVQQESKQSRGNLQTQATAFDRSPALPDGLFEVRAGVPAHFALEQARCLADCIRKLSVENDTLDGQSNYLVGFTVDAIHALIESVEQ